MIHGRWRSRKRAAGVHRARMRATGRNEMLFEIWIQLTIDRLRYAHVNFYHRYWNDWQALDQLMNEERNGGEVLHKRSQMIVIF